MGIYDEFPEMYQLAAGRFFREHLPVRNWLYNGHAYHQGDSYGAHRYSWDTFPLFVFDRLGAGNVYNPEQRFVPYLWVYTTRPDGQRLRAGDTFMHSRRRGQPWTEFDDLLAPDSGYRTGQVLTHACGPDAQTPDFTLLQGDITAAYSKKVKQVIRSFAFLNLRNARVPAALVAFDRVVSADPAFRKSWLLHALEKPRVDGASAIVDRTEHGADGRLTLDVLLPPAQNASLEKLGGPGKEFWVFGENYSNEPVSTKPNRAKPLDNSMEVGAWRLELSPKTASADDLFLTVVQVSDRSAGVRWPVRRIEAGDHVGCLIEGDAGSWCVLFRRDGRRSDTRMTFTASGQATCRFLVTGLAPGTWRARRADGTDTRTMEVLADSGAAWFTGPAGAWTLSQ